MAYSFGTTVAQLIEELKKYPQDETIWGFNEICGDFCIPEIFYSRDSKNDPVLMIGCNTNEFYDEENDNYL